jgi:hypothetical protein
MTSKFKTGDVIFIRYVNLPLLVLDVLQHNKSPRHRQAINYINSNGRETIFVCLPLAATRYMYESGPFCGRVLFTETSSFALQAEIDARL